MNRISYLATGVWVLGSAPVWCGDLPTGGQVVLGTGSIGGTAKDMVVTQGSSKLAIDWQSFDVGRNNTVTFNQPSRDAIALNRVLGSDGSQILGRLSANGQVFLINPNGVLFGHDAQVNVSGLVASTLDLSVQDFDAGHFHFRNSVDTHGSAVNLGSIVADNGGAVALLGGSVSNQGTIVANQGTVALAAGSAVTLDFAGDNLVGVRIDEATRGALVENHQLIEADGGRVILSARAADTVLRDVVNNDGIVRARSLTTRNGEIVLDGGSEGGVHIAGNVDASSSDGSGGSITVRGENITVDSGAILDASGGSRTAGSSITNANGGRSGLTSAGGANGSTNGSGGSISVIANNSMVVQGSLLARGGAQGGDGGLIETSGRTVSIGNSASISTLAAHGTSGTWLIDPDGFTVSSSGGDMTGTALTNALAAGNVAIASTEGSGSDGAITIDDGVQWSANTLTLTATTNINVNNVMVASGTAGLHATYGTGADANGVPYGLYTSQGLQGFDGRVDFTGSGGVVLNGTSYGVITNATDFAGMTENGNYVLGTGLADTFVGHTIPSFSGHLNGFGHTLIYANAFFNPGDPIGGLFGTLGDNAVVSNIGLKSGAGSINGGSPVSTVGSLANINRGSIVNSYSSVPANVDADSIGGLVGTNYGLIARSFFEDAPVVVSSVGGGLVGINETGGRIVDSSVRGGPDSTVSAKVTVTVIPGSKPSEDQYIVTAAPVTYIGGLVGINKGDIKQSWTSYYLYTDPNAKAADIPGFMGGGFVGLNTGTIDQSYAYRDTSSIALGGTGTSQASAELMDAIGGFVGENRGTITNAYAFDTLFGNRGVSAGFAYENSGTIADSYARRSTLTNFGASAGFVHESSGTLSNVYWSYGTKPDTTPEPGGPGTQLSDAAADELASYGGFDPSIWESAASGFPMLKSLSRLYVGNIAGDSLQYGDPVLGSQLGGLGVAGLQAGDARDSLQTALAPTLNSNYLSFGHLDVGTYNSAKVVELGSSPYTVQGYFSVSPRVLQTNNPIRDKVYDGTTAAQLDNSLTGGFTNLVGSQRLGYTYTASFNEKDASSTPIGGILTYTSLSDGINGGKASNYVLPDPVGFAARISPRPLTVTNLTVGAGDKTYDGTTGATINLSTSDSVAGSEMAAGILGLHYSSAQFADTNAGTGKTVTVSGVTLLGSGASNYTLATSTLTDTADITPRPVNVFGSRAGSDGPTLLDSSLLSLGNVLPADTVHLSGSATLASTEAGTHPLNLSGFSLDNPNYTLSGGIGGYLIGDVRRGAVAWDSSVSFDAALNPTVINVSSDKAVINWQNFNIGANETVQFIQPNSYSIVLNRVLGSDPSSIAGILNANGRVFILNPNGVLFAAGSSVNVAALVASTLDLSDGDFKNGDYFVFKASAAGSGSVVADGDIVIVDGGFLALAGQDVSSSGRSTVHGGTVLLASTDSLTLAVNGSNNGAAGYGLGNLTGVTTANGHVDVSSTITTGGWIETAGSGLAVNEASLDTGTLGTWSVSLPTATIGSGGTYDGSFVNSQLSKRNFLLDAMSGDLSVTDDISWSTNTQLSLLSAGTVGISARIASSGASGGLALSGTYLIDEARLDFNGNQTGHSGAGITLSGANARLSIDGEAYTLLDSMADFSRINAAGGAGHYALAQSIDAAGSGYSGAVVPLLAGTFAGLGNTINHLDIDAGLGSNVGLIGTATSGAMIRDIGIINSTVRGHSDVGILLGSGHDAVVGYSFATGTVTGTADDATGNDGSSRVGGLIGSLDHSTLQGSHADVTVTGGYSLNGGKSSNTGGLLGFAINSTIVDSYATGDVTGSDYTGGLAGLLSTVSTQNVWASGNVRGVPGNPVPPTDANTIDGASNVGGLAGGVEGLSAGSSVVNVRATGNVSGGSSLGGLIGSTDSSVTIDHAAATGNVTTEVPIFSQDAPASIGGLVGRNMADISNSSASGDVTSTYLSLDGIVATQIGGFVGINDGGTISGSTASGTVRGGAEMGGFVGLNSDGGTIINSSATGNVIGNTSVIGGFFGFNDPTSSVADSTATGDVVGWNEVGGFGGGNMGTVTGVTATGNVQSDPSGSRDGKTPGTLVSSLIANETGQTDAASHGSGAVGVLTSAGNPGSSQTPRDAALDAAVQGAQQFATNDQLPPALRQRDDGQNLQGSLNASARESRAADATEFSSSVRSIEVDGVLYQFDEPSDKETSGPSNRPAEPDPLYDLKDGGVKLPPALQRSQSHSPRRGGH